MQLGAGIPAFDRHGNLPIGDLFSAGGQRLSLLDVSLQQIRTRFVDDFPHSKTRVKIWDGWMRHREELERFGIPYATMVDGSFVTAEQNPKDVDICLLMEAESINALESTDRHAFSELGRLTDTTYTRPRFECDTYLLRLYRINSPRFALMPREFTYWARVFGTDRKNRPKNYLLVTQRGVL
jgi:hypothetical protein